MGDIKEEVKGGETHYQKVLKPRLDEAEGMLDPPVEKEDKMAFCVKTWKVFRVLCTKQDRKVVKQLIHKRINNGDASKLHNYSEFKQLVSSNPYDVGAIMFDGSMLNLEKWLDIYNIMREALGNRYAGNSRTITEEDMQEGLDEEPDEKELDLDFEFDDKEENNEG